MSDRRYTDPSYDYAQPSDLAGGSGESAWGWVAGVVVIALIAVFLIAGGKGLNNAASNSSPPSTIGMGTPQIPAHSPANSGAQ